tara:strand:+ start:124 stop:378 length:255 start_codon:yes stop_codon:yes gene_type:complete
MNIYYKVYIKKDCSFCDKTLKLLDKKRQEYIVNIMDHNEELLSEVKDTWGWETVPIIIEISERRGFNFIGGYTDLCKHLGDEID